MSTGETWTLGHRPALDGLRGVAVLLVVTAHSLNGLLITAGPVGVTVFFVLSGFLITALLLQEHARSRRIDLAAFYLRRARRLFPALALFLVVMLAVGLTTRETVLPVALYVGNWVHVGDGDLGFLVHTWSLAVEEQFYIVFPLVAVALLRRSRRALVAVCAVGVALSFGLRVGLWQAGAELERFYAGTDTNAGALLLGCLLAAVLHDRAPHVARRRLAVLALAGCGLLALAPSGKAAFALVPIAAAVLAAVALYALAGDGYRGALDAAWLRLVGRRSYGLYLWHMPPMLLAQALPWSMWVTVPLLLALAWGLTLASWRYVEQPFLANAKRPVAALDRPRTEHAPPARHAEPVVAAL